MLDQQQLSTIAETLRVEYNSGTIVSERHLQALLFNLLRPWLANGLAVLIEPNVTTIEKKSNINGLIPDMLIVDQINRKVKAVVEIKYVPYGYPEFEKDLKTFAMFQAAIHERDTNIYLMTQPRDGNWDTDIQFSIAEDLKFFYMVIANHNADIFTRTNELVQKYIRIAEFRPIFILIDPNIDPTNSPIRVTIE